MIGVFFFQNDFSNPKRSPLSRPVWFRRGHRAPSGDHRSGSAHGRGDFADPLAGQAMTKRSEEPGGWLRLVGLAVFWGFKERFW